MLEFHHRRLARIAWALASAAFLAAPGAWAQVDLPRKNEPGETTGAKGGDAKPAKQDAGAGERKQPSGRSVVPHLVCAVCNERNYTAARNRPTEAGFFTAWCANCRTDQLHKPSENSPSGELDLPDRTQRAAPAPAPEAAKPAATDASGAPQASESPSLVAPPRGGDRRAAAAFIYQKLDEGPVGVQLMEQAVESLYAMGEDGLVASRVALHDETEPRVLVAARVLLRGGSSEDALRIVARLRSRLREELGPRLLQDLLEQDPVHGSPALLVELLDHPQLRMRTAAQRELQKRLSPELLPLLAKALESDRAETRLTALQLVASISDPGVFDLLVQHLDDPAARVASQAVASVAGIDDPRVDLELEARAFSGRWTLRENAYALLAIIEREDISLKPILDERHAEPLLRALEMTDPFVYGTCAAALAGIGFRAEQLEDSSWLDREVTGRLVDVVSGREFHTDFSALQPRALRRLTLITGNDFGGDGPAWARWWVDNRSTFYARRVRISVEGERVAMLELHYRSTSAATGAFALFGPEANEEAVRARAGVSETFRITPAACRALADVLEREGALGAERLPGLRGEPGEHTRKIEVLVDGRGKSFSFADGVVEPWFERVAAALHDVFDRNRWQRFPDLAEHVSERAFWEAEAPWWEAEHSELERALRLKALVLGAARGFSPSQRNVVVDELERLYAIADVPALDDFRPLVELLRDEGFFVERSRRLLSLAVRAGREGGEPAGGSLPPELASNLLDLLNARFGVESADAMADLAVSCGRAFPRELAKEHRPLLRAVAADAIGRAIAAEQAAGTALQSEDALADRQVLIAMLEDSEPFVEAAACLALGTARAEEARTDLLVRARVGEPAVRAAALRAIAKLGGEYVLEALVLGASAPEAEVRTAAAEGLAEVRDPRTAAVLVSMLGQGRDSEVFEPARKGLIALGEAAFPELARVANSSVHHARREATLLLAYQGVPRAASGLIGILDDDPQDALVAEELCVLSCVDFRAADDPAAEWSGWWNQVVHDDSRAWLRAAMERRGIAAPGPEALRGSGTLEGALFLLAVLERPESWLSERGRRELARLLGEELPAQPHATDEREAWLAALRARVGERFDS